jgi:hypothetical protein
VLVRNDGGVVTPRLSALSLVHYLERTESQLEVVDTHELIDIIVDNIFVLLLSSISFLPGTFRTYKIPLKS